MSAPSFRTIIIPAAVGPVPGSLSEYVNGRVFATIASTDLYFVRADNRSAIEQKSGRYFGNPEAEEFGRLLFQNYTAAPNTVTFYAGSEIYKPDSPGSATSVSVTTVGKNAATYTKGTTAALASGGTQVFSGFDGALVRKSFSVFNSHATDDLNVRGANGILMHVVVARTGYVVEAGNAITLHVPGANAITYAVAEVFYS